LLLYFFPQFYQFHSAEEQNRYSSPTRHVHAQQHIFANQSNTQSCNFLFISSFPFLTSTSLPRAHLSLVQTRFL